jgi:hypothetical protein
VLVSEKYWRYHFSKGIEFIKQELKLWVILLSNTV